MIHVDNITFYRGERCILQDVSCTFEDAACTMLLGPNGAGKTTLLDIVAGFLPSAQGDIYYDEQLAQTLSQQKLAQSRAVVSQHSQLSFPFTVRDVVLFGRNPFNNGHPHKNDYTIAEHCLELVEAQHLLHKNYLQLSGGEQQMVHLARALAQIWQENGRFWNKHLFLDESLSNLDLQHQSVIGKLIRDLCDKGCCIIMVIHDLNLAYRFGDRFILLAEQGIQAQGGPDLFEDITTLERVYRCQLDTKQDLALFPHL